MPTLVMKFGGTSVANLDRIARASKRVAREVANGYNVIVIVSAMSGKTNELVGWVNETSPLYDAREYDGVVSSGENVTAGLMALRLQEMDIPARSWQGWQVPVKTTDAHSSARIEEIPTENIEANASPLKPIDLIEYKSEKDLIFEVACLNGAFFKFSLEIPAPSSTITICSNPDLFKST